MTLDSNLDEGAIELTGKDIQPDYCPDSLEIIEGHPIRECRRSDYECEHIVIALRCKYCFERVGDKI